MALFPLQPGLKPAGQFDVVDTDLASIVGGQVMTFTTASRTNTSTEGAAYDVLDGYDWAQSSGNRVAATLASDGYTLPLLLADDGTAPDYLTYFGSVVGASAGANLSGTAIGPHTAEGSGKITLWGASGLYAVTTNALSTNFVDALGPGGLAPGSTLGFDANGRIAHAAASAEIDTGCASFVEFDTSGSLVTSNAKLVGATESFTRIKIMFNGGMMADRTIV